MTKNNISIRNLSPERAVIDIEGTIGVDENMQFSNPGSRVATYEKLSDTLLRISEIEAPEVVVNIRSTGGDVNDALLIYEALKSLRGRVVTCCYGYTASAATVIAQAASAGCRRIASGALYLIHNSVCAAEGNVAELVASTDLLRKTDERLAALYAERSGASVDGFVALMAENNGAGRWLSPAEAVEAGLADEVIDDPHREEDPKGRKASAADGKGVGNTAALPAGGHETEPATEARTAEAVDTAEATAAKPLGRFADLSAVAAAERSLGYSAGKSADTADTLAGKPVGRAADTSVAAAAEKPVRASVGRAADLSAVAAAERSLGYSVGKSADTAETLAGKPVGGFADTAVAAAAEERGGKSADGAAATAAEISAENSGKKSTEDPAGNSVGKTAENDAGKPVAGWRTLLRQLRNLFAGGKRDTEERDGSFRTAAPPVDRNILHTDDPDPLHEMIRSRIAFNRGQNAVRATATLPVEDPAACDSHRSANQRAYAEDARRMSL